MNSQKPNGILSSKLVSAEFLTGLLFVGALIILFYFTALVRGKDLFLSGREFVITVKFPGAGTLSENDKVRVIGVEMGRVKKMTLSGENNEVYVELLLKREIQIYKDYHITIQNSSVFGGGYVNIFPGASKAGIVPKDEILIGRPPIDIMYEASGLIAALRDDEKLLHSALEGKFFDNISEAAKSLGENSKEFNAVWADIRSGKGTLGKLFSDSAVYDEAKKSFENVGEASAKITSLLSDLQAGKGSLGKIISDDKAYNTLIDSMEKMREVVAKISSGEGTLGKFVNDKGELYNSISGSMKTAEEIALELKGGKGTLGMMIKDDSLYLELKETVRQFRAAIEDYREMSPIATFGSMLLGAL